MFIIFDSAPESIKKSFSMSGVCNCLDFGLSKIQLIVYFFSYLQICIFWFILIDINCV